MQRVPMTRQGAEAMRKQLDYLKNEKRHQIIATIEEARAHGDLSENAEYHAAKDDQGMNEAKVKDLEDKLARAQVIDPASIEAESIVFGATIELVDCDTAKSVTYQIVGEDEADLSRGMISVTSPIARALIGKEEGDVATVHAPGGIREYEIGKVIYR
ncbi:MAG: transcription elongation factor GreA [Zetaproteobacteria bacterium CG_4_9_14_3_um_filter_49_83]|nr:MAG: transcription elongation factor GreA [Zetaproteobacteria bacterium CG1_02_49_23]PIQ30855.1 MAG: transcription elongation factor GreA [Zetaproteobacteria bacterium CG17_big_fil_post_rev_8_21_14_2_50_50_13]PIY56111.1 MAG: transcription elongation factor GreA [Zetaproteobacteria bacterium CG_4_10_14_0_8_um_filter_49_80]PJA34551.1 MAG: transcription elongation factor GreA [Zetaproteobacteria bacterium CG_4_9_14_3_um_filter_49_83]